MNGELLDVTTIDGFRLHGYWQSPGKTHARQAPPLDACVLIHGTGGTFYSSTLLAHLAGLLLGEGIAALRVNTRGHDLVSTAATSHGPRRQGAAYETLDDCRHDLQAWIDLCVARGCQRVGLLGHSSGAVKAVYAQAQQPHPAVRRLIALSPPRLSYQSFVHGRERQTFLAQYEAARQLVDQGNGQQLIEVTFPLPMLITAAGYVEKYGPEEKYDVLSHLGLLRVPTLVTFGSQEVADHPAFAELPQAVRNLRQQHTSLEVVVVAGADHFYSASLTELSAPLTRWLRDASS